MYLTTDQHNRLRTIAMNFEIPFRTFIACEILEKYSTLEVFSLALTTKDEPKGISQTFKSQIGKIKSQSERVYSLLVLSKESMKKRIIETEINVPDVATIVGLIMIFHVEFKSFIECFSDYDGFITQIEKYH